ncbi:hypothetical protein [Sphingomonas sp. J344]|nr:hypothetical protein [Sphingomonas sp. J344]
MVAFCASVDIIVADRWLPRGCVPKWLKLDRAKLSETGGVAITFDRTPQVVTVRRAGARHPWLEAETVMPPKD